MLACAMVFVACEPQIHRNDQDKLGIDQQNNGDVCNKMDPGGNFHYKSSGLGSSVK